MTIEIPEKASQLEIAQFIAIAILEYEMDTNEAYRLGREVCNQVDLFRGISRAKRIHYLRELTLEITNDDCTCDERSWYGPYHDSACPLAGKKR